VKEEEKKIRIDVRLPRYQIQALDKIARVTGSTRAELIRLCIEQLVKFFGIARKIEDENMLADVISIFLGSRLHNYVLQADLEVITKEILSKEAVGLSQALNVLKKGGEKSG